MDMGKIGNFLTELRKEKGLTQEQLGQKLGVTNKTVSRWETGKYLPPVEILQSISKLYGVSINELLSGCRLTETEYPIQAEENLKAAISESSFSLKERMDFFKRKWRKEHCFQYVLAVLATVGLYAAGFILDNRLQIVGILWIVSFLVIQNNEMMKYVEQRAFDGSGRQ